jgi:hypothetical protein
MEVILKRGTRCHSIRFLLIQAEGNAGGATGLSDVSAGVSVAYLRDGDITPTPVALRPWKAESHVPGGFREIDPHLMPGVYELGLPDEICAEGANRATLMARAPGIMPLVIHIDLVGYDPYDRDRLGLDCLSREGRHEVISRAFREVVPEIVEEFRRKAERDIN